MPLTLSEIKPGNSCRVVGWSSNLSDRLLELGLIPGSMIDVIRKAPFGDPVVYKVKNCQLAISRVDAARIFVRVLRDARPQSPDYDEKD